MFQYQDSGIALSVSFHSYGRMWMYPWGYTDGHTGFPWDCVHTEDYDDLVIALGIKGFSLENAF